MTLPSEKARRVDGYRTQHLAQESQRDGERGSDGREGEIAGKDGSYTHDAAPVQVEGKASGRSLSSSLSPEKKDERYAGESDDVDAQDRRQIAHPGRKETVDPIHDGDEAAYEAREERIHPVLPSPASSIPLC